MIAAFWIYVGVGAVMVISGFIGATVCASDYERRGRKYLKEYVRNWLYVFAMGWVWPLVLPGAVVFGFYWLCLLCYREGKRAYRVAFQEV